MTNIRMRLEQVTPEMACKWLEKNVSNRRIVQGRVDRLVRDIKQGNFLLTGDTIKFDQDGNLVDGQHRLWGIVTAGVPVEIYVVRGVATETRDVIDTGKARTLGDAFAINGEANGPLLGGIVNMCIKYEKDKWVSNEYPTHREALEWLAENGDVRGATLIGNNVNKELRIAPSPVGASYFLNARVDPEAAFEFWTKAQKGTDLTANDPILAYRRWVLGVLNKRDRPTPRVQFAYALTAMNAWRSGKPVRIIHWRQETGLPDLWV